MEVNGNTTKKMTGGKSTCDAIIMAYYNDALRLSTWSKELKQVSHSPLKFDKVENSRTTTKQNDMMNIKAAEI